MDPRRPFFPNTPGNPSNQPPFGFPNTPGTPATQPLSFGAFNAPLNPWQFQQQPWQMHPPQMQPPQWQPMPETQTQHEHDFVSLASHDDHIPETQPETEPAPSKKTVKKGKKRAKDDGPSTKADSIPWNPIELEALAQAWVIASTDPILATNRKKEGFWNQVVKEFFKLLQREEYRRVHSVSTNCRDLMTKCQAFGGFYQRAWNNRASGQSDEHVLKVALDAYTKKHGAFGYMKAYEILAKCEKFKPVPNEVEQAKRSKTSATGSYSGGGSDARCTININDDPEFEDEAPPSESERPIGRDRAKKAAASKGKGVDTGHGSRDKAVEKIEELLKNFNDFKQEQTDRYLERKKEKEETAARELARLEMERKDKEDAAARDLARIELERERLKMEMARQETTELALMREPLDNLDETERAVAAKIKDKIARKWLGGAFGGAFS